MQNIQPEDADLLGHMMTKVPVIAEQEGLSESGYRMVVNCKGDGGQEIFHLHFHIMGKRKMSWPPG